MRRLCLAVLASAVAVGGCAPRTPQTLAERFPAIDDKVVLPKSARPKADYVRHYAELTVRRPDDVPFTTVVDDVPVGAHVVVGVFVAPGHWGVEGPGRLKLVGSAKALPYAVHGGCDAVNVLIDPATGETVSSWCNVEDGRPGTPGPADPVYIRGRVAP